MRFSTRDFGNLVPKVKELLLGHVCAIHQAFLAIHEGSSLKLCVTDLRNNMRGARVAFGMGLHPRLGERSPLSSLGPRLAKRILNTYWDSLGNDPSRAGLLADTTALSFSPQLYSPVPAPLASLGHETARASSPPPRVGRPIAEDPGFHGGVPASACAARPNPREQADARPSLLPPTTHAQAPQQHAHAAANPFRILAPGRPPPDAGLRHKARETEPSGPEQAAQVAGGSTALPSPNRSPAPARPLLSGRAGSEFPPASRRRRYECFYIFSITSLFVPTT